MVLGADPACNAITDIFNDSICVLGTPVAHTFPSNYRIALEALNAGRPVVLDNHNKLAAAITGFARGLVETNDEPSPGRRQTGLFGRLTGRRS